MNTFRVRSCRTCGLRNLCFPHDLEEEDTTRFSSCVEHLDRLPPGSLLFGEGDELIGVYVVHGGLVATYRTAPDGRLRIADFWGPGSVLEGENLEAGHHQTTAKVLEPVDLCLLTKVAYDRLVREMPHLESTLLRMVSQVLNRKLATRVVLKQDSEEKILHRFLLALITGFVSEGQGSLQAPWLAQLILPREELGAYLNLGQEGLKRAVNGGRLRGRVFLEGETLVVPQAGAIYAGAH